MLNLIYHDTDQATARRLTADFGAAGIPSADLTAGGTQAKGDVLLVVVSPAGTADAQKRVETALFEALDLGLAILPVQVNGAPLPKWIDHLPAANFTDSYDFARVQSLYADITAPGVKLPLKVLTPRARKANQRTGWVVGAAVIIMFVAGLYGVGVLGIQAPADEYISVNQTAQSMIRTEMAPPLATMEGYLPRNPDEAFVYVATLLVQPTRYRPYIAATATAAAIESGIYPATVTPTAAP